MINRIRDVRRARKMTLDDVAQRCVPQTTAQTIGRLETGTRTLSLGWMNRIAAALGVDSGELVRGDTGGDLAVVAMLSAKGVHALTKPMRMHLPRSGGNRVAMQVDSGVGDYRAGDSVWLQQLQPEAFNTALNRDVLVPRPAGRFLFGRLLGHDNGLLHLLPPGAGQRQQVVKDPPWIAVAETLIRTL